MYNWDNDQQKPAKYPEDGVKNCETDRVTKNECPHHRRTCQMWPQTNRFKLFGNRDELYFFLHRALGPNLSGGGWYLRAFPLNTVGTWLLAKLPVLIVSKFSMISLALFCLARISSKKETNGLETPSRTRRLGHSTPLLVWRPYFFSFSATLVSCSSFRNLAAC